MPLTPGASPWEMHPQSEGSDRWKVVEPQKDGSERIIAENLRSLEAQAIAGALDSFAIMAGIVERENPRLLEVAEVIRMFKLVEDTGWLTEDIIIDEERFAEQDAYEKRIGREQAEWLMNTGYFLAMCR